MIQCGPESVPLRNCAGVPINYNLDRVPTCAEMADAIAAAGIGGQALQDCLGVVHPIGAQVPTCAQMNAAIAGVTPGQALEACGGGVLPDGTQVVQCADVGVAVQAQLQDCLGAPHVLGAQVPTCAQMNAAIAGVIPGQALEACGGGVLPNGTQVIQCSEIGTAVQAQLQDCLGAPHALNAQLPTCVQMDAAIAAAVGAVVPGQQLEDCSGNLLAPGTEVVTCAFAEAVYFRLDGSNQPVTGPTDWGHSLFERARIAAYSEILEDDPLVAGVANINPTAAQNWRFLLDANATVNIAPTINAPIDFDIINLTVILVQDGVGSRTVTWPASVRWPGGTPPTLTTTPNQRDVFTLFTYDAGVTWLGFTAGLNFAP